MLQQFLKTLIGFLMLCASCLAILIGAKILEVIGMLTIFDLILITAVLACSYLIGRAVIGD